MWSLVPQCFVDGLPWACQGERLDYNSILLTRHSQDIFPEILLGSTWAHSTSVSTKEEAVSIAYPSLVIKTFRTFVFTRTPSLSSFMVLVSLEPEENVPNCLQKEAWNVVFMIAKATSERAIQLSWSIPIYWLNY